MLLCQTTSCPTHIPSHPPPLSATIPPFCVIFLRSLSFLPSPPVLSLWSGGERGQKPAVNVPGWTALYACVFLCCLFGEGEGGGLVMVGMVVRGGRGGGDGGCRRERRGGSSTRASNSTTRRVGVCVWGSLTSADCSASLQIPPRPPFSLLLLHPPTPPSLPSHKLPSTPPQGA